MKKILLSILGLLLSYSLTFAQSTTVNGKVTAVSDGLPLPGVSVSVKGNPAVGTLTDAQGLFKLNVSANATTLVFKYIGYRQKEVPVSTSMMDVQMDEEQKQLSEVVVVGYGTQIKQDLTGSISGVKAKDIANLPLPTFETALQGRAAGVFINSGSGKLGQAINIRIRGISSVSASNQPLFVIDGQPVISQSLGSSTEPDNPLSSIAPEDILSIDVLKDASAAAIYGSRAANGVILVTTKSGIQGRTQVSVGYYTGFSQPTRKQEFLNAAQYKELFGEAASNMGYDAAEEFEAESGTTDWNENYDTNWADKAFQDGAISQYSVSMNGGDSKTRFLVNGGYSDQKGIIAGNKLNRANGRINLDHSVVKNLKIGLNLSLNKTVNYRVASDNAFTNPLQLNAIPSIQAFIDPATGSLNRSTFYYNNLIDLVEATNESKQFRSLSNAFLDWDIIPSLKFRSEFGFDIVQLEEEQFNGRETLDGAPSGYAFNNQVRASSYNTNNVLTYTKVFDKHNIELLGGVSFQEARTFSTSSTGQGFPSDKFTKIASAAIISAGNSTETGFSFLSYFSRANYKFNNRYLLSGSVRVDGSSRFGSDNRYGVFPAVSAGWIVSQENFLKESTAISFLKLRASYGTTGNSEIGNFASRTLYGASPYADQSGIVFSQLGRPDLSWEKTNQLDIGLDFGLFNDRISMELDYFNKQTSDLLLNLPLPATNGFTVITKNLGSLENKGFEASLNTQNLVGDFKWSTSFNISTYKNKLTNLNGSTIDGGGRQLGRISEGEPYGYFYGPKYAGVNRENGNAQYYEEDGSIVDQDDFSGYSQKVGDPNPEFIGGFGNKFSFKNFDLDVQTQFVYGNDLYNIAGFFQSVNGDYFDNQTVDQLKRWQKPGDITNVPQARLYEGNGAIKSSRWVQDGSYFRVKNVVLGYNLPKSFISRAKIQNARIFAAAQNLFTFTDYSGYDPEVNATYTGNVNLGHDFYTPPQARTITFGINMGF
ncbi:SusC/RagA family TonB-linked outer membrane protein [Daejeonella oryzae]|uniref:SusC/RagA family TonB-linked outer membrane protein n=1 Tax=Daejeonella oryzae TaxID=1122943 RepID=UPI00041E1A31|nr:TonB-dependent receptor [Daejeonella oryzae]